MSRKTKKIITLVAIIGISVALYFALRDRKANDNNIQTNTVNPTAQDQPEAAKMPDSENKIAENKTEPAKNQSTPEEKPTPQIPEKYLLDMPFYSQAPFSNWDKVHEEMCEEASLLNAGLYLLDKKLSKDAFEKELINIKKLEEKELGDYKSNTISEIKKISDIYFGGNISLKIIDNPTIDNIESEISAGRPVIVPLSGRDIGNPNFTPPGPIYHMLVLKGYDSQNFITNDVGTRKGNSYIYKKAVIMKDMHDWNAKDIHLGAKKVLVLMKND